MLETRYKKAIEKLRDDRQRCRSEVGVVTQEIELMLNKFHYDDGDHYIPVSEFMNLEIGVPFHVNDKVSFTRQHSGPNKVNFLTYMKAGGSFGLQSHDVTEHVKVLSGHLVELTRGRKQYVSGQEIIYAPMEQHKPFAEIDSIYEVWFDIENLNLTPKA